MEVDHRGDLDGVELGSPVKAGGLFVKDFALGSGFAFLLLAQGHVMEDHPGDADQQHARCQRIERTGMPHFDFPIARLAEVELDLAHHIGRTPPTGFVDDGDIPLLEIDFIQIFRYHDIRFTCNPNASPVPLHSGIAHSFRRPAVDKPHAGTAGRFFAAPFPAAELRRRFFSSLSRAGLSRATRPSGIQSDNCGAGIGEASIGAAAQGRHPRAAAGRAMHLKSDAISLSL